MSDSMGRVAAGDAAMEWFNALLQKNVLDRQRWKSRDDLRDAIIHWVEHTYNRRRRQRRLGRLTTFNPVCNTRRTIAVNNPLSPVSSTPSDRGASNQLLGPLTHLGRLSYCRHATRHRHQPVPVVSSSRSHGCDPFRHDPSSRGRSDHATHTKFRHPYQVSMMGRFLPALAAAGGAACRMTVIYRLVSAGSITSSISKCDAMLTALPTSYIRSVICWTVRSRSSGSSVTAIYIRAEHPDTPLSSQVLDRKY